MNDTLTITYSGQLKIDRCWCGMPHAVPIELWRHMKQQHEARKTQVGIYCPAGHPWVFGGKRQADIERERAEVAERRATNAENAARHQRERAERLERSRSALKGQITKMRNRIASGCCPVPGCKRTGLTQTMRHIATKHPQWHAEHADELT